MIPTRHSHLLLHVFFFNCFGFCAKALELQAKMDERKEWKEDLERQEKERRRNSVAHKVSFVLVCLAIFNH